MTDVLLVPEEEPSLATWTLQLLVAGVPLMLLIDIAFGPPALEPQGA